MLVIGRVFTFFYGFIIDLIVRKFYTLSKKITAQGQSFSERQMKKLLNIAYHLTVWDRAFIQDHYPDIYHLYLNGLSEGGGVMAVLTNGFCREQYDSRSYLEEQGINTRKVLNITRDLIEKGEKQKLYFIFYPEMNEYISFSKEYRHVARALSNMSDKKEEIKHILTYAGFYVPVIGS